VSTGTWSAYGASTRSPGAGAGDGERSLRNLDWTLMSAVLALSGLGALLVWSATRQDMIDNGGDPQAFLKKHLLNLVIGLVLGFVVCRFDYRMLRAYAPFLYALSLAGLVLVLAVGDEVFGAKAWILLPGGFSVQPSEFAKVGLILCMAMILSEKREGESGPRHRDVLSGLALAGVPLVLVLLQNDLGTVMVLGAITFGLIAMSGAPARWVVGILLVAVVGAGVVVATGALQDHQVKRLIAFTNPSIDPRGAGYNTKQARLAIGSGGLTGKGLFEGPQTQGKFVPVQESDFIYTVAGEELGFLGAGAIIALTGVVLLRAIHIGFRSPDLFGRLVCAGVVCWFTFQAFENIGMSLGIMPVTGLPLPFVSYGGSSMFANLMAVGLLQNVHLRRP
jgi:rod shape determining protein RodA